MLDKPHILYLLPNWFNKFNIIILSPKKIVYLFVFLFETLCCGVHWRHHKVTSNDYPLHVVRT